MRKILWILTILLWTHEPAWPGVCVLHTTNPAMKIPINLDHVIAYTDSKRGGTILVLSTGNEKEVLEPYEYIDEWCLGRGTRITPFQPTKPEEVENESPRRVLPRNRLAQ